MVTLLLHFSTRHIEPTGETSWNKEGRSFHWLPSKSKASSPCNSREGENAFSVFLLFNKFFLSAYSVPDTVIGSGEAAVHKTRSEGLHEAYDLGEGSGGGGDTINSYRLWQLAIAIKKENEAK